MHSLYRMFIIILKNLDLVDKGVWTVFCRSYWTLVGGLKQDFWGCQAGKCLETLRYFSHPETHPIRQQTVLLKFNAENSQSLQIRRLDCKESHDCRDILKIVCQTSSVSAYQASQHITHVFLYLTLDCIWDKLLLAIQSFLLTFGTQHRNST